MNNSQILAEFQSVLPKSPGLGQGRAWTSLSFELSVVFEVDLLVKKGAVGEGVGIGGKVVTMVSCKCEV